MRCENEIKHNEDIYSWKFIMLDESKKAKLQWNFSLHSA